MRRVPAGSYRGIMEVEGRTAANNPSKAGARLHSMRFSFSRGPTGTFGIHQGRIQIPEPDPYGSDRTKAPVIDQKAAGSQI